MARLAKSAAESLSVYLCNSVQSLSRVSAENETERERDQRENQRVNESERENPRVSGNQLHISSR